MPFSVVTQQFTCSQQKSFDVATQRDQHVRHKENCNMQFYSLSPQETLQPDIIFVKNFHTSACSKFSKFTPKKRANRDILDLKYYIFGVAINLIGIISLFSNVYAHFINE